MLDLKNLFACSRLKDRAKGGDAMKAPLGRTMSDSYEELETREKRRGHKKNRLEDYERSKRKKRIYIRENEMGICGLIRAPELKTTISFI